VNDRLYIEQRKNPVKEKKELLESCGGSEQHGF
jgi:hypothetical protein